MIYWLDLFGVGQTVAGSVGILAGLALRLAAIRWRLNLPVFSLGKSN